MKFLALLMFFMLIPLSLAHGTVEEHNETITIHDLEEQIQSDRAYGTDWSVISPFSYFTQGRWFVGLLVMSAWILFLRALYVLFMLVASRVAS